MLNYPGADFSMCPPCIDKRYKKNQIEWMWFQKKWKYIFNYSGLPIGEVLVQLAEYQRERYKEIKKIFPYG